MSAIEKLELDRVTRRFGQTVALHEFNLSVPGYSFVTLLGPSGCGKSTALNCLAGLLELSSGRILVNGQRIDHLPAEKRNIGMVFQNYALFPHLTVYKNVAFGLEIRRTRRDLINKKVDEALKLVRLDNFKERYPWQLSGGQQQRLAFARAIVLEPSLLLLDEPLSNLDAKLRNELRLEIKRLHERLKVTTVYVTHDQSEAMSLSDIVIVMQAGKIEQAGPPQEIYRHPASLFVADFMGYKNRYAVEVTQSDRQGVRLLGQGLDLVATGTFDLRPGQKAIACFRPDDAVITKNGEANAFDAKVELVEYLGKEYEAEAVLHNGERVLLQFPTELRGGENLRVAIPTDRLMVYAADDSTKEGEDGKSN